MRRFYAIIISFDSSPWLISFTACSFKQANNERSSWFRSSSLGEVTFVSRFVSAFVLANAKFTELLFCEICPWSDVVIDICFLSNSVYECFFSNFNCFKGLGEDFYATSCLFLKDFTRGFYAFVGFSNFVNWTGGRLFKCSLATEFSLLLATDL